MKSLVKNIMGQFGSSILGRNRSPAFPLDFTKEELAILDSVKPFTMTSPESLVSLIRSVEYLVKNQIPGAIVECGVWRGGSTMAAVKALQNFGNTSRRIFLFDTFDGMSPPSDHDKLWFGTPASEVLRQSGKNADRSSPWCYASLEDVKQNFEGIGYPPEKISFIQGRVEDTLPGCETGEIALLRLDSDWYESTKHELTHLYPRLVKHGVLIIDDYGVWEGARKATDEFLRANGIKLLLHRIDQTVRAAIKVD